MTMLSTVSSLPMSLHTKLIPLRLRRDRSIVIPLKLEKSRTSDVLSDWVLICSTVLKPYRYLSDELSESIGFILVALNTVYH